MIHPSMDNKRKGNTESIMATAPDQRKHPRRAALYDAKYTIGSVTYRDSIGNVSAGGIYIYSKRSINLGQPISLRFPIMAFDKRPSVEGMVIRCEPNGFAVKFDRPIDGSPF